MYKNFPFKSVVAGRQTFFMALSSSPSSLHFQLVFNNFTTIQRINVWPFRRWPPIVCIHVRVCVACVLLTVLLTVCSELIYNSFVQPNFVEFFTKYILLRAIRLLVCHSPLSLSLVVRLRGRLKLRPGAQRASFLLKKNFPKNRFLFYVYPAGN